VRSTTAGRPLNTEKRWAHWHSHPRLAEHSRSSSLRTAPTHLSLGPHHPLLPTLASARDLVLLRRPVNPEPTTTLPPHSTPRAVAHPSLPDRAVAATKHSSSEWVMPTRLDRTTCLPLREVDMLDSDRPLNRNTRPHRLIPLIRATRPRRTACPPWTSSSAIPSAR
jgi:hypothetical protein